MLIKNNKIYVGECDDDDDDDDDDDGDGQWCQLQSNDYLVCKSNINIISHHT